MVLGTPRDARRLYRNTLNFCQETPHAALHRFASASLARPSATLGSRACRKRTWSGRRSPDTPCAAKSEKVGRPPSSAPSMPTHGVVAVKVLREKLRQDKTAVARFVREARYGERVRHPTWCRRSRWARPAPGMHFLAIEWAKGELLERYVKQHAPLPADEVAAIITQIADAVQAAHAVGIVHRDLKPDNVMYDPATRQVKLLDFGIATDTDMAPEQRLTRAGFFVGTLMYVAPEALSGELVYAGGRSVQPRDDRLPAAHAAACRSRRRRRARCSRSSSRSRRCR